MKPYIWLLTFCLARAAECVYPAQGQHSGSDTLATTKKAGGSWCLILESNLDKWTVASKSRSYLYSATPDKYNRFTHTEHGGTIEKIQIDSGLRWKPVVLYFNRDSGLFFRGSYSLITSDIFGGGKSEHKEICLDTGILAQGIGLLLGYRRLGVSFSGLASEDIIDHATADVVWGIFWDADLAIPGFNMGFETLIGTRQTLAVLFGWLMASRSTTLPGGTDETDPFKGKYPNIFEFKFDLGYRFKQLPVFINAGYGYGHYGQPVNKNTAGLTTSIREMENSKHSAIARIGVIF